MPKISWEGEIKVMDGLPKKHFALWRRKLLEDSTLAILDFSPNWLPCMGGVLWTKRKGRLVENHLPLFVAFQIWRLRIHIPGRRGWKNILNG